MDDLLSLARTDGAAFDYGQLEPLVAEETRGAADRIRGATKRQLEQVVAIGRDLKAVKDRLGHGQFGVWLEAEFGWSVRTAQNMMVVAERFAEKCAMVSHLPLGVVYRVAAAPEEVRAEVVSRAATGAIVTPAIVNEIVAEKKAAAAEALLTGEQRKARDTAQKRKRDRDAKADAAWAAERARAEEERLARVNRAAILLTSLLPPHHVAAVIEALDSENSYEVIKALGGRGEFRLRDAWIREVKAGKPFDFDKESAPGSKEVGHG